MIGLDSLMNSSPAIRRACDELSQRLRSGIGCGAEEFLAAEPALASDTDAALELLYTEFVVRQQLGQQPEPSEWFERFPQWRAELVQLFEVHALVDGDETLAAGLSGTHGGVESPSIGQDCLAADRVRSRFLGGYEILQEIGRGGMGVVYQAKQRGLSRIVALKMILPPHGERERARFRAEAEATARLSHPNIVPIYEVGQEGDCPFLSMEFVAGQSLDKKLGDSLLAPRTAAELIETLARAVAYAHEQGIIHRDLKPANILLSVVSSPSSVVKAPLHRATDDGQLTVPKITDFGLAKTMNEGQASAQSVAIVGTPSYMAPEQCDPAGAVSPATDVYALGAILYEALTGRPPFRGQTALDILELVRSHEPVPPGCLTPKLPRDLETICLKCLAKQPDQRYASATALADDLRRFLAGEPILARPVGRSERAVRWCRRNPAVAALTSGILFVLVGGMAVSTSMAVWAVREKSRADQHAQQEQTARELAEYRFGQAEKAVEDYLDGIENDARLKEADFFDLRKQLLSSAMPFYEDFVQARPSDAQLEAKRGRAYGRLALLRRHVGEHERSAADYRQVKSIFQKLAADFPDISEHRQLQARGHHGLSLQLRELGRPREALDEIHLAIALQEDLVAALPSAAAYRQDLAQSRHMLGMLLHGLGHHEAAVAEYQQVFTLKEPLAAENPGNPSYRLDLSRSHNNLANVLLALGKQAEAVDEMRQALSLKQALVAEFPKVAAYRQNLAASNYNLGVLFNQLGQSAEAEAEHRQGIALGKSLADEYPTVPAYRLDLARNHYFLGRLLRNDRPLEAEVELREALSLRSKLNAEVTGVPEYRADLATSYAGVGSIARALGKPAEAMAGYQQAIDVWLPLLAEFPGLDAHRSSMASHMNSLAALLREHGKLNEARRMHDLAIEHRLKLLQATPTSRNYATSLRNYYHALGDTALVQKDHVVAADTATRMAQVRPAVAADAELAARFFGRCLTLARKDRELSDDERQALEISYANQAMEQLREAVRRGYKDAAALKTQAALAPLRGRPDFQQLVQELEAQQITGQLPDCGTFLPPAGIW